MKRNGIFLLILSVLAFGWTSCDDDDNNMDEATGELSLEVTDAPIDDSRVEATFVTISDIRLGGNSLEGYQETTVDVYALQNGMTELLADSEVEAGTYQTIELDLNYDTDADGNSPGCYVEDSEGTQHPLGTGEQTVSLSTDLSVEADSRVEYVLDFDLRKCIERSEGASEYQFTGNTDLEAGLRLINKNRAGIIEGNCEDSFSSSDRIVVYAYAEGTYNRNTETQEQNGRAFANAENSASVQANGNYELHFLEEGNYELVFASYEEDAEGNMELQGTLELDVLSSINIDNITVDAGATVTLDVLVTGLLGL